MPFPQRHCFCIDHNGEKKCCTCVLELVTLDRDTWKKRALRLENEVARLQRSGAGAAA